MSKWRPEGWNETKKNLVYQTPNIIKESVSELEAVCDLIERTTDTILADLRTSPERKPNREGGGGFDFITGVKRDCSTRTSIPDDPISIPEKQLICPKGSDCNEYKDGFCCHRYKHKFIEGVCDQTGITCEVCVPYIEPEKVYKMTVPPFIAIKIEDNDGVIYRHPASEIIEKGYFCKKCGKPIPIGEDTPNCMPHCVLHNEKRMKWGFGNETGTFTDGN